MTRTRWPSRATRWPNEGRILRCARSPEAPKMTRSAARATLKILRGSVDDHLRACQLVMDGASKPAQRQREQPDHGLADGGPRTVDSDHTLANDQPAKGATRDAPTRHVVCGSDAEQHSRSRPAAEEGRRE